VRSPVFAIAWEFWNANRRGWLFVFAALVLCGALVHLLGRAGAKPESIELFGYVPLVTSLILAISFCNFTDRNRRDGIAGFPRHLFSLPVNTGLMVTCAMLCSILSVLLIYIAWVTLVLKPLDVATLLRWPATLLTAFVVFYQAIIWCLCGFRLTRVVSLSLVATSLVAVGFMPTLIPDKTFWNSEIHLSASLIAVAAVAYGATLATVGAQRRGGARGWAWFQEFLDRILITIPHRRCALTSAEAALFWIEWRRIGFVLPTAVLLTTVLVLGLTLGVSGGGREATFRAETWLVMLPLLLAFPIGLGFGKPDFWSLDLSLPTFVATRPISAGQILAARMKVAAGTTLLTWAGLFAVAPVFVYLYCDTTHWRDLSEMWRILYSPLVQWLLPLLLIAAAMLMTWGLLVAQMWLGYSGRSGLY